MIWVISKWRVSPLDKTRTDFSMPHTVPLHGTWQEEVRASIVALSSSGKQIILAFFCFWLCNTACRILVPRPGIKPTPPAVEAQSLNHWTTREVCPGPILNSTGSFHHQHWVILHSCSLYVLKYSSVLELRPMRFRDGSSLFSPQV